MSGSLSRPITKTIIPYPHRKIKKNQKKGQQTNVSRKGRTYLIDEYAAELLKPKTTKKASVSSSDIEKLKEEQQLLTAKQREISEKIRQTENSLFIQRNEKIAAAVFKALGREYMPGDEVRISEYLAGCDDFKIYMNSKTEETEEENCV